MTEVTKGSGARSGRCCRWCGGTDHLQPIALEEHHASGRANDPALTILLCRSCHGYAHDLLRLHEVNLSHAAQRSLPDVVVAVLVGIALTLIEWGRRLFYWAHRLDCLCAALDDTYPDWRQLPEAQP